MPINQFKALAKRNGPAFRFWVRCLMSDALHDRDYALRRMIETLAYRYGSGLTANRQARDWLSRYSRFVADLTELWDVAAGLHTSENERQIWAHLIGAPLCNHQAAQANRWMQLLRPEAFGPIIFRASQMLDSDALEFAHDYEIWRLTPQADPSAIAQRVREHMGQTFRSPMHKLQDYAKPPRYPQNLAVAESVLALAEAGQINPSTPKARNEAGASLIRAAVAIWNQDEPPTAAQVHRAFLNPGLVENERVQKLLLEARKVFNRPPNTPQTIANYLRAQ